MDEPQVETTNANSPNGVSNEEGEESPDNESWEEEFNPLGLLDLVYVEQEEEKNESCIKENDAVPSTSTSADMMEMEKLLTSNSSDSDEGEELEPVAAVDVLPGREEDFFPEGLSQEVMEPSRSAWTTSRVSNDDTANHQWNLQESQGESILQHALEFPQQIWNQHLGSTYQFTWKAPYLVNVSQNHLSGGHLFRPPSWKSTAQQEKANLARRLYYQRYRQKNPELVRIRNREYARRYRQTHAERVRERQREYIKRYRERKRLEKNQSVLLEGRSEQNEIITVSDKNGLQAAVLLSRDNTRKDIVQNKPAMTDSLKSKKSDQVVLDVNEGNEIVVLS